MSRSGTPYDNACAETFFKTIKVECLNRKHFETRRAAEDAVMVYILFYNRVRVHQSLDYLAPCTFRIRSSVLGVSRFTTGTTFCCVRQFATIPLLWRFDLASLYNTKGPHG
jgi:hypothetical protein